MTDAASPRRPGHGGLLVFQHRARCRWWRALEHSGSEYHQPPSRCLRAPSALRPASSRCCWRLLVAQVNAQRDVFRVGVRNGRGAGDGRAAWPLRIAGEQIAGYPVLARVLAGADQILIQHFAQVRLQLREAVAVRQADALLDAQVIELCATVSGPPSTQLPLRVPISLYAGSTVVQALSNSAKGKTAAIVLFSSYYLM